MSNKVVQLKDPQGNNIYPISADDGNLTYVTAEGNIPSSNYALGTVLAWAECHTAFSFNGQPDQIKLCSDGTWEQYGVMKRTTEKWSITIQAPADENWYVMLHAMADKFSVNTSRGCGISLAEVSGTTILHKLDTALAGTSVTTILSSAAECVVEIPAGTSKTFATFVYSNCSVYGLGPDSSTLWHSGWPIYFRATLLDKEKI